MEDLKNSIAFILSHFCEGAIERQETHVEFLKLFNKHKLQWLREIAPKKQGLEPNGTPDEYDHGYVDGVNDTIFKLFANAKESIEKKSIGEKGEV